MSRRIRVVAYKQYVVVSSFPKCAFYWINYPLAYLMFVSKEQLQAHGRGARTRPSLLRRVLNVRVIRLFDH